MDSSNASISKREKFEFWWGAWVIVAVVSMVPHPSQLLLAPFFPLGLFALLPHGEDKVINGAMTVTPCFLGWILYAVISVALFRASRKRRFITVYTVFCILLALNVIGCKLTLKAVAGIH